jgi:serine O-acetyltransferase
MIANLSFRDFAILWGMPIALAAAAWLLGSLAVYFVVTRSKGSALYEDFGRRYERKKALRSGARVHRSYWYVAKLLLADSSFQATVLYRTSRFFVRHGLRSVADAIHAISKLITHIDISPHAEIGSGLYLYHGLGTVIGKGTCVGRRAVICQTVTTGGGPTLGDDVFLWAGAKVLGKVKVGDGAEVGANAVVIRDVPPRHVALGVPADRLIEKVPKAIGTPPPGEASCSGYMR